MGLHCIASLVYNPPDRRKVYDFAFKLNFDNIKPRYPGRAVFSVRSKNSSWNPRSLDVSTFKRKTFERLRAEAGSGRLGEADKSVPGSRIRLFESPVRMFVVQVRGSVGDCALPALNIDAGKRELSCEWRDLFDRFFGERRITTTALNSAPVGHPDYIKVVFVADLTVSRWTRYRLIQETISSLSTTLPRSMCSSVN